MSLSKKNIEKLKSFKVFQENDHLDKTNKEFIEKENMPSESSPLSCQKPEDIFYEIIDNSENLNDTLLINHKLKKYEENSSKFNKNILPSAISIENKLTEEELLYDEFNYLLEE